MWASPARVLRWFVWLQLLYMLYKHQDRILYVPEVPGLPRRTCDNPEQFRSPATSNVPFEELFITTSDGVRLHAWFLHQAAEKETAPTVVFFHGNAGSAWLLRPTSPLLVFHRVASPCVLRCGRARLLFTRARAERVGSSLPQISAFACRMRSQCTRRCAATCCWWTTEATE